MDTYNNFQLEIHVKFSLDFLTSFFCMFHLSIGILLTMVFEHF
jgi:hypothetical protein